MKGAAMTFRELPIPPHFDPDAVGKVWRVLYEERQKDANGWAQEHAVTTSSKDAFKICLILIDEQNTFCTPDFELFVGGRSGTGAVDDSGRLCRFIYRYLNKITNITVTLDTHHPIQIFHSIFLVNEKGEHPGPFSLITAEDIENGTWKFNEAVSSSLGIDAAYGHAFLSHYVGELKKREKFDLTIWPYHAMLGSIGHALVSSIEEAVFFHAVARNAQPDSIIKGRHALSEHYSALGPEIRTDRRGSTVATRDDTLVRKVKEYDAVIITGQAKSHCVTWTVDDLRRELEQQDSSLLTKIYLLEDCTSPVVVPGAIDYTEDANRIFDSFAGAGMRIVRSTDPMDQWPGIIRRIAQ
jgi:nicotinamidase-related amidase